MDQNLSFKKILLLVFLIISSFELSAQKFKEMTKDSTDAAFDISGVLNSDMSFMPVPILITEPAVGYGGGLVLAYFHKKKYETKNKGLSPTVSFGAGIYTANKTWAAILGHQGYYLKDRIRYLGVLGYMSVNLTFYGGDFDILKGEYEFNMNGFLTMQEVLYKINKERPFFMGLNYTYFNNNIDFKTGLDIPGLEKLSAETNMGGVNSVFLWDGRNNSFTPTKGVYSLLEVGRFATYFGGDNNYWNFNSSTFAYLPIVDSKLFSGYRLNIKSKSGDVRFFELPFISLRGIPIFRYQGYDVYTVETEWRWQMVKRWSLVGFVGAGEAMRNWDEIGNDIKVAGGGGFRYLLAREYGLHAGVDIARGPEIWAWNLTIGTHWGR